MLVLGAAGTGKTIVTKLKLLEKILGARDKERIALFVPENMLQEYKLFFEENATGKQKRKVHIEFYSLSNQDFIELLKFELEKGSNIFIDDSQHFYQFQRMFELKDELTKWRFENPDKQLWITLDWWQFIVNGPLIVKKLLIPNWLFPEAVFHLECMMRNTKEIIEFASLLQRELSLPIKSSNIPTDPISYTRGIIEIDRPQETPKTPQAGEIGEPQGADTSTKKPDLKGSAVFSKLTSQGHKISGNRIQLIRWQQEHSSKEELILFRHAAVVDALKRLNEKKIFITEKVVGLIYSASWIDIEIEPGQETPFATSLQKRYSYEISSEEFKAVIFAIYIPENFEKSIGTKITIFSQIYQAVTRAQTHLIIISDPISIQRLRNSVGNFDINFEISEVAVEVCKFYLI